MKFLRWLDEHFEEFLMAFGLWMIVLIMTIQVICRYILKSSLSWSDELCRYLFVWFTFLGISFAIKNHSHVRIDIFETIFPKLKRPLEYIGDFLFFVFSVYMMKPSFTALMGLMEKGQTSPAMEVPMWIVYLAFNVGFVLTIIRIIQKYVLKFMNRKKEGAA